MNRPELVRYVKESSDDGQIQLREKELQVDAQRMTFAHARIARQGTTVDGYGIGPTRDHAIDTALCETIERLSFRFWRVSPQDFRAFSWFRRQIDAFTQNRELRDLHNLGNHSVGCAVGSSRRRSEVSAVTELIERHTVLVAQLMRKPGLRINQGDLRWNEKNISIGQHCWRGPLATFTVLSEIINKEDGRVLFSTGCGDTVASASAKSRLEALAMAENFDFVAPTPPDIQSSNSISDLKHWHMLNPSRTPFYRGDADLATPPDIDVSLGADQFWTATRQLKEGLFFARAYSPGIQNLFVGNWQPSRINQRFRHLWDAEMEPPYAY